MRLQGFEPEWFDVPGISPADAVRAAGDAVPPPLALAVAVVLMRGHSWINRTHLEICAGAGGLASGFGGEFESLGLLDQWGVSATLLRHEKPWEPGVVHVASVRTFDFSRFRDRVGVLSGGPPCQPWSTAGARLGQDDPRDVLGHVDSIIAAVRPEAFVFENVPGLLSPRFEAYFDDLMRRLRAPAPELRYGVLAAVLNAADYGVPQLRKRVFFIGLRDAPTSEVAAIFDRIDALATHRGQLWRTVGEIVVSDHEHAGWMHWPYSLG